MKTCKIKFLSLFVAMLLIIEVNAQNIAKELRALMDVKPEEWVNDVRATRHEM